MRKGDILWAKDRKTHFHPIVFLETMDVVRFKACILSSEPTNGNILMDLSHFCVYDENNHLYIFQYKNTHLVISDTFIKMGYWVESENIVGRLTEEGIAFVESNVPKQPVLCVAPIWEYRPLR